MSLAAQIALTALWGLAVARLTVLFSRDLATDWLRARIIGRWGEHSTPAYFAGCPWCQSIWIAGAAAVPLVIATGMSWWTYPLLVLAGSEVSGLLAAWLPGEVDEIVIEDDD